MHVSMCVSIFTYLILKRYMHTYLEYTTKNKKKIIMYTLEFSHENKQEK